MTSRVRSMRAKLPVEVTLPSAHPGFASAIKANPRDWTSRLIYADWLEEHGEDDRARKIRLRVEEQQNDECNGARVKCKQCKGKGNRGVRCVGIRKFTCRLTGKKLQQPIDRLILCESCLGEGRVPKLRNLAWILGYGD